MQGGENDVLVVTNSRVGSNAVIHREHSSSRKLGVPCLLCRVIRMQSSRACMHPAGNLVLIALIFWFDSCKCIHAHVNIVKQCKVSLHESASKVLCARAYKIVNSSE